MEDSAGKIYYETRLHASGPYTSNYPPLQQRQGGANGGVLSFLSARGISQLKAKWNEYRNPKKLKKPISLFVSPSGKRVAVVAGDQVTILRQEDDYQSPYGFFASNTSGSFTHGAWSEPHGVLGLVDDNDMIYFIKENGEEISRASKQDMKVSSSVIGLIAQGVTDVQTSLLCSFIVLTSDGVLYCAEISQQPSASISSGHIRDVRRQFPRNVFCFDYSKDLSLLVVVGSSSNYPVTSINTSGPCVISLWHRQQDLVLDPLSCTLFEGTYYVQSDYKSELAYPKVLISPQGNHIAAIDMNGQINVFKWDEGSRSLLNIGLEGRSDFQLTDQSLNECTEILRDVVDFTWWCDHFLTLVKRTGPVIMVDIVSGLKQVGTRPTQSISCVERVQKTQGHIFLLESSSSAKKVGSSDSIRRDEVEQISEAVSTASEFSRLHWRLMSFCEKSIPEMYKILISTCKYEAALDFANCHQLDRDEVLKSQWLNSEKGICDINKYLSNIKDHRFVLSQCVEEVGPTEAAAKALLSHGLQLTDLYRFAGSEDHESGDILDFRMSRLQLLQFSDKLETFLGINMGRFSMQDYWKFRVMSVNETAVTLSESGKIGALNLLFKRHPYSLSPFMLEILAAIPETIPVKSYAQLLPGRCPPTNIAMREEDWVECDRMVKFIEKLPDNHEIASLIRTEPIIRRSLGFIWPSVDNLSAWYKNRARDIDSYSGLLENCLCLVDIACQKGIYQLQQFLEDISYLHQLVYSDSVDAEMSSALSLLAWEKLSDYEKFKQMLKGWKEEDIIEQLHSKAVPFMQKRMRGTRASQEQGATGHFPGDHGNNESFLVRWLKEAAAENRLDICLLVFEESCKDVESFGFFKDVTEAVNCALQCLYNCTSTDSWGTMAAILSSLPHKRDAEIHVGDLEQRCKVSEGHVEAGRLLAFYQVPKPITFFLEAHLDEKGVKQILRLVLSRFMRRQPSPADNDWANIWRDMLCLRDKAFPFLDLDYMLTEFCRGLLKAGKFSLARNYLKGTGSVALTTERAENLVVQAAREYFYSASSLTSSEIWKARECLNIFPSSRVLKAEADLIDVLTVKLPDLGVSLLPMQFRQIKDPMEIIKMAITQTGAYLHAEELIEVAKLLGLNSSEEVSAVQEAIAREAAVAGDLQLAFDLCTALARKGHGVVWDLCAAIARGPPLENMDISSRKQLLGFALSHCDEESVGELLHAWKDLDMQDQCETLMILTGTSSSTFSIQGTSVISLPGYSMQEIADLKNCPRFAEGTNTDDQEAHLNNIKTMLNIVSRSLPVENGSSWDSVLKENGKILSFAAIQLPWLIALTEKVEYQKKFSTPVLGKQYVSVRSQAVVTILSWLARNGFAPSDYLVGSLAKSIMEPPVTEVDDVIGCSFLLNIIDAYSGVDVIEEQLRTRKNYQEISSIMNTGMTYSMLHSHGLECVGPAARRGLLLRKFKEKQKSTDSDEIEEFDKVQSSFWGEWKLKLEEKKQVADQSRVLEQIIPGVDTARFLSGDINYIRSTVFSLIDSLKFEKKRILKDLLELSHTHGLSQAEVILRYLTSVLTSDIWTDADIMVGISDVKEGILSYPLETIETLSLVVYPAIDGCKKQRLAIIFGLLSQCYIQLEENKQPLPVIDPDSAYALPIGLPQFYKLIQQECERISFIEHLNFKNVAGLSGVNLQHFSAEVYSHIDEINLDALAKMVQNMSSIFSGSVPEGLISWQDIYKYFLQNILNSLDDSARKMFEAKNPENFQDLVAQLEQTYDFCRNYIKLLEPSDSFNIMKQYFTVILPPYGTSSFPDTSTWQECLVLLLHFWIRLSKEMQEFALSLSSSESTKFYPECLISCFKSVMRLVVEDSVSPSECWELITGYLRHGLNDDSSVELFNFCKAMVFAGCGFRAVSEVFLESVSECPLPADLDYQDLPHLYLKVLEAILQSVEGGSLEYEKLYRLVSSLGHLDGNLEELKRVRSIVWERTVRFSANLQLPSNVRVHALELMQFISGESTKSFPSEVQQNVLSWEGWDAELYVKAETSNSDRVLDSAQSSSGFTSTLVALKSSQLASSISTSIEITPDDLSNVDSTVSCFLRLTEVSTATHHFKVLLAILEEWEGLFVVRGEIATAEATDAEHIWNGDDWDEGWESFQEVEVVEKKKDAASSVHPLHICWAELLTKLAVSQSGDVLKLIDESVSKSGTVLLDEGDVRRLSHSIIGSNFMMAVKIMLILPYESVQLESLDMMEEKLKQEGISDLMSKEHEFLLLALSSGVISSIISKSSYGTVFSYICYLVGSLSHQFQEAQLSKQTKRKKDEDRGDNDGMLFLFMRILFPAFVSEQVKAGQHILAGYILTKIMHTSPSLCLINVADASLHRYLERQLHILSSEETNTCEILPNTVAKLKGRLNDLLESALSSLPRNNNR